MNDEIEEIFSYFIKYMPIKDCIKIKKLEDYIINLEQENDNLLEIMNYDKDKIKRKLIDLTFENNTLQYECETLQQQLKGFDVSKDFKDYIDSIKEELTDYKSRLEKASEYMNDRMEEFKNAGSSRKNIKACHYHMLLSDLLNILQNGSDEE